MAFYCIHTAVGLQLLAQAEATGTQIQLTHMAVGDGNGNPVTPAESMTSLVRERFRATVNRVYQDAENPLMFTAELIIPASAAGFTMREVGIFDSNGNLFVVGNLPDTYKPAASDGAFSDSVVRVPFMVSNASTVTLKIDPNVIVATQSWIINNITPALLIPGGTTSQVLRKKSNADGDFEWSDPEFANIIVDVVEEEQTLAASQTTVTWATVTNTGLAVYIEGVRIVEKAGTDGWQIDSATPNTQIILGKAYPAGTKILGVQNEPLGDVPFPLEASKNLSDVPNKTTARSNLGVYSKTDVDSKVTQAAPAGMVAHFAKNTPPTGWIKANGAAVSRTAYAGLFAAIGTTFGSGDGFNTFNVPDLRGEFVRGWDDGRNVDPLRVFGSYQADDIKQHRHLNGFADDSYSSGTSGHVYGETTEGMPGQSEGRAESIAGGLANARQGYTSYTGITETRPRNRAMLACIKF